MTRVEREHIRDGEAAFTVDIRTDLTIEVDAEGRVLAVERTADSVWPRDLEDVIRELVDPPTLTASIVVATLRTVAPMLVGDEDRAVLYEIAEQVERDPGPDSMPCPVCEEITCDGGCPMEAVRRG